MPNWVYTTYVFRSKEKEPILDFNNKLLTWDKTSFHLCDILNHAGFDTDDDEFDRTYKCSYRGTLESVGEIEEEDLCGEHFFYFVIDTQTALVEMARMWELIIEKFYLGKIEFGFLAEEESAEFIDMYRPDIMELNGILPEEKYWIDQYTGDYGDTRFRWLEEYGGLITSEIAATVLSTLLEKEVGKEEIEDDKQRAELLDEANDMLEQVNDDYYIRIININMVSSDDFS